MEIAILEQESKHQADETQDMEQDDIVSPQLAMEQNEEQNEGQLVVKEIPELKLGARYCDYEEMMKSIEKYSMENNYVYTTAKSKTIASIYNKINVRTRRDYSPKLKVCYVLLGCKHYGKVRSQGKGIRPNQKTYKSNCPSHIEVKADHEATQLVITKFVEEHNHATGPEVARFYPERRRLSKREEDIFREQLGSTDVSPALLHQYVKKTTNKAVSHKDIYNLRQKIKSPVRVRPLKPVSIIKVSKVEQRQPVVYSEDHPYAEATSQPEWDQVEYVPEFLDEREVDYEETDPAATDAADVMRVEKVNEAWKCVYMVLEDENKGLKAEIEALKEELRKAKMAATARKSTSCVKCSKTFLSNVNSSRPRQQARPTTTISVARLFQSIADNAPSSPDAAMVSEADAQEQAEQE